MLPLRVIPEMEDRAGQFVARDLAGCFCGWAMVSDP
jgi:hypothetical protein